LDREFAVIQIAKYESPYTFQLFSAGEVSNQCVVSIADALVILEKAEPQSIEYGVA
jgi:hypothetical protein